MFKRFYKNRYGYSRWDGTQNIEGLDADDILNALADDYMEEGNLQQARKRLMQDGIRSEDGRKTMGLRELMERMRNMRNEQLNRYNMASGVMDDLREKLEEIKSLEREGIQKRLDGDSEPSQSSQSSDEQQSPGQQQRTSRPQDGSEQESQQGSSSSQQGQSGEGSDDLTQEQKRQMLEMIAKRKQDYLDKLPQDVPGQIKGLSEYDFMYDEAREKFKELMDSLQQQMMQQFFQGMQQSLQNMTPEDIAKMREMIRDLNKMLRDRQEGLEPDFDSFMQKHGEYFPGVNSLDDLIEQMQQQMAAMQGIMDNLSPEQRQELQDLMEQLMGDDRIRVDMMELAMNLEALAPMEQTRTRFPFRGDESLPLNEAMRMMNRLQQMEGLEDQIGEARRLDDLEAIDSEKVKDLLGDEEYQSVEQLKEFMEMLVEAGYIQKKGNHWELTAQGMRKIGQKALQDIFNKLKRDGFGLHVSPFRGVGGERTDESKSYQFGDPFLLDLEKTLMNAIHRRGTGTPVGLEKDDFEVYRTELNKQIIMITDGGPTMWFEDGEWQFGYPPNPYAEQQTLLEVQRCTRERITINTFMLEDDRWMVAFVNQLSAINHGRTFYADKNNLGEYLLIDYLNSKRKYIAYMGEDWDGRPQSDPGGKLQGG